MELLRLKIFRDVAHEKSFVKAAKLNHLTQPSVSAHIRHLEEELTVQLFERSPRKTALTSAGKILLPIAEEILLKSQHLKDLFLSPQSQQGVRESIRVAAIPTIGIYGLSALWKGFIETHPHFHIDLHYLSCEEIYQSLLDGKIDLGIVAYPEKRMGVNVILFGSDELIAIVAPQHRLAEEKSIFLRQIHGEDYVAFEKNSPTQQYIDRILREKRVQITLQMTHDNIDTLKRGVEAGVGISIVPALTVKEEVRNQTLRALKIRDRGMVRPLGMVTLEKNHLSRPCHLLITFLLDHRNRKKMVKHEPHPPLSL